MLLACPDCGTVQQTPATTRQGRIVCCRCANTLERAAGRSLDASLALGASTFLLLFPANLLTLLSVSAAGIERSSRLGSGVVGMWAEGWLLLALVVGLQGVVLPFFRFGLLSAVLVAIRLQRQGDWTGMAFRWTERLDVWAMPDVFLFGAAVGYSRVAAKLPMRIGPGGWALVAVAVLAMLTRATLDRRATWRMIKAPPPAEAGQTLACTDCQIVLPARFQGGGARDAAHEYIAGGHSRCAMLARSSRRAICFTPWPTGFL